jgi:hypothetical protein
MVTKGLKGAVEEARREAMRNRLRLRLAERIEEGTGVDRSPGLLGRTRPAR